MRFKSNKQRKAVMAKLNRHQRFCAERPDYCASERARGADPLHPSPPERIYRKLVDTKDQDRQMRIIRLKKEKRLKEIKKIS